MKLSICIPSYNRPVELGRCLDSIKNLNCEQLEVVISDDCSPRQDEISSVVSQYKSFLSLIYIPRKTNIGYDSNLNFLAECATSEFILFVSDDDFFGDEKIDSTLDFIETSKDSVIFTPILGLDGELRRTFSESGHYEVASSFALAKFAWESILFSGLIYNRIEFLSFDVQRFKSSIYFQVYTACMLASASGFGYINSPLITVGGDGENGFGHNSKGCDSDLSSRNDTLSDFSYHKRLYHIIEVVNDESHFKPITAFRVLYCLRLIPRFFHAKSSGFCELKALRDRLLEDSISYSIFTHMMFFISRLTPGFLVPFIQRLSRMYLKYEHSRSGL